MKVDPFVFNVASLKRVKCKVLSWECDARTEEGDVTIPWYMESSIEWFIFKILFLFYYTLCTKVAPFCIYNEFALVIKIKK